MKYYLYYFNVLFDSKWNNIFPELTWFSPGFNLLFSDIMM
jgi:hypothetical protein